MGVNSRPLPGNFVERDSYLPSGWTKQVCSDPEGNGFISYASPTGETFSSRKAVDDFLNNVNELQGDLYSDQQKITKSNSLDVDESSKIMETDDVNSVFDDSPNTTVEDFKNEPTIEVGDDYDSSKDISDQLAGENDNVELSGELDFDDDDSDEEVDDNQCNICGKIFEEDKGLTLHVEDIHKDYYFDEDNSLLLKENMVSKENTVSKCKLCLENFKAEDLQQHMKGLHPSDYVEDENKEKYDSMGEEDVDKDQQHMKGLHPSDYLDDENKEKYDSMEEEDVDKDEETETQAKHSVEPNEEENISDDEEVDDNQCNVCGKIFEEEKGLTLHVEDVHKDYYFDEDNSLLLKENMVLKENIVSKCTLCLENFMTEDLQQHMKGLHPSDYLEDEKKSFFRSLSLENNKQDDHMEQEHEENESEAKHSIEPEDKSDDREISDNKGNGNQDIYIKDEDIVKEKYDDINMKDEDIVKEKYDEVPNVRQVNIIIEDNENKNIGENVSFNEQVAEQRNYFPQSSTLSDKVPVKIEPKLESHPSNNKSILGKRQNVNEAPYRCNLCDIKYYVRSHMQVHNERMHKTAKWKCDSCLTVHPTENDLGEHNSSEKHAQKTKAFAQHLGNSELRRQNLPNYQQHPNYQPVSKQPRYLDENKWNPQGDIGNLLNPQISISQTSNLQNLHRNIPQTSSDKWNPHVSNPNPSNVEHNPPQYIPQPRNKEPSVINVAIEPPVQDIKPILAQPKPTQPPPSPPRPMDPVTKLNLARVSQICQDLHLSDYPIPVNPSSKAIFADPHSFGAYLLPLLMSVNPRARMQDLITLGRAKWTQLKKSQSGAVNPRVENNWLRSASVVNTVGLVHHMKHLQILKSIDAE